MGLVLLKQSMTELEKKNADLEQELTYLKARLAKLEALLNKKPSSKSKS